MDWGPMLWAQNLLFPRGNRQVTHNADDLCQVLLKQHRMQAVILGSLNNQQLQMRTVGQSPT